MTTKDSRKQGMTAKANDSRRQRTSAASTPGAGGGPTDRNRSPGYTGGTSDAVGSSDATFRLQDQGRS